MPIPDRPVAPSRLIDPRGPRFGAAITSVVLATALLLPPVVGTWLIAFQAVVFACGAVLGLSYQPYGFIYGTFIRPRLGEPRDLEDAAPPRFAQVVGLAFALVSLLGAVLHADWLYYGAAAFALVAALLNAVFNVCLGCEMYLVGRRLSRRVSGAEA